MESSRSDSESKIGFLCFAAEAAPLATGFAVADFFGPTFVEADDLGPACFLELFFFDSCSFS